MPCDTSPRADLAWGELGGASEEGKPRGQDQISASPTATCICSQSQMSALVKESSLPPLLGWMVEGSWDKRLSFRGDQASSGASLATGRGGSPEAGRPLEQTWFKGEKLHSPTVTFL